MTKQSVNSPCIAVCVLDVDDVCEGCFRTGDEITDWFMADDDQKRAILARCHERRDARQSIKLL